LKAVERLIALLSDRLSDEQKMRLNGKKHAIETTLSKEGAAQANVHFHTVETGPMSFAKAVVKGFL